MDDVSTLQRLFRYKAHANRELLGAMQQLDDGAPAREIAVRTISHTSVVDQIFAAHLSGTRHGYDAANKVEAPTLEELAAEISACDQWYIDYVSRLAQPQLSEVIDFTFTDGDPGRMSREEMLMHVLMHGEHHRGQVDWMLLEAAVEPPTDGLTSFLHKSEAAARRRAGAQGLVDAPNAAFASPPGPAAAPEPKAPASRLDELTTRMREAVGADSGLGKSLSFNLKGEGFIHIDGASVTNEDKPADLTLTVTIDDLAAIGQGRLTPMAAIMNGRLRLSDMGVAAGLQRKMQALFARMRPAS